MTQATNTSPLQSVYSPIASPVRKVHVYDIDVSSSTATPKHNSIQAGLNSFLLTLVQTTITDPNRRQFRFKPDSFAKATLNKYFKSSDPALDITLSQELADKLLQVEIKTSSRVKQLNKGVKRGSLVVCHYKSNDLDCIIATKLDFEKFVERDTYAQKQGLPERNGVLKSCVINVTDGELEDEVYLLDSNKSIASFWSLSFLDSLPFVDDSINTKKAFREITKTFSGLSRSSKADYQQLKNNLISYFSTNASFTVTGLIDALVGDYQPISDKVDLTEIKSKINALVKDKVFDGSFVIDDKEIKSKYKQTFKLDGGITLTTAEGFNDRIYKKVIDGENYLLIKTVKGLDQVKDYPTN